MIILQTQNVARRFGSEYLFKNVNLQVQDRSRVALVGRNGAGKTTLLKMLAQITQPDEGEISTKKDTTIGYLAQDQGLDSSLTIWNELDTVYADLHEQENKIHVLENKIATLDSSTDEYADVLRQYDLLQSNYASNGGFEIESQMRGVLNGFGFADEYQTVVSSLSGGQKTKLALAKLLLQKPDLLILDEPTNHLDMTILGWLEDFLKNYSGALLIVSHDRYFLDRVVNEVYDMSQGTLKHYTGNYSQFMDLKAEDLKTEMKHYEHQQAEINKLEDFVNRNIVRASTTKRAQARRKQLDKMKVMDRPTTDDQSIHFTFKQDSPSGNIVLRADELAIGYDDKKIAGPINFELVKPNRLGVIGPNGIGKSTMIRTILSMIPKISGDVKLGANVKVGYYDQEQQVLHPNKTVLQEIWDDYPTVDEREIRTLLGSFLFIGDDVFKTVSSLSGGEKARLQLTKLSFEHSNFLVLDEPTNHLDIDSREVLEHAINEFDGTVLFISHDRYFINQVATQILAVSENNSAVYKGDYDDYLLELEKHAVTETASSTEKGPTTNYQQNKEQQRERRKVERRVEQFETEMNQLEDKKTAIETQMADPDNASDGTKLGDLQLELNDLAEKLEIVEANWTQAAEELEQFD
ncbi:ABC-F family ATP-binding cassette domain-containing protein [Paucilactobacillus nenjiangensis]|uniref:ABC-F family ATP-binding cassette domain-containing protein n=1 Tax=Paucilactobacillus nenjiangensis TaxID=1296540 RepID=A0A5P1X3L4_9LACO|nr:ABC-F family ATP-binding cassette domain-containing protein [Paucilactobacillus nenjiangensis]QER67995.1 ABC-F family ATP-binding cassette domain-containing protein [Paucilactobacillus nenjiangensis]